MKGSSCSGNELGEPWEGGAACPHLCNSQQGWREADVQCFQYETSQRIPCSRTKKKKKRLELYFTDETKTLQDFTFETELLRIPKA